MLNIVVPMAGRGSRFANAGFKRPKPLILVHDSVPMIQLVVENLRPSINHRFIFICLQEHLDDFELEKKLNQIAPGSIVVPVNEVTEGAACTVLLAQEYINSEEPLMIANSDQYVDIKIDDYLNAMADGDYDGFIMTMTADDPKWSFIRLDNKNQITEVVEKVVVSDEATVGIYNYKHGSLFVEAANDMIRNDIRVNNEFYVAPAYNTMINKGAKLGYMNVGSEFHGMYGLGIPEDLVKYESLEWTKTLVNTLAKDN